MYGKVHFVLFQSVISECGHLSVIFLLILRSVTTETGNMFEKSWNICGIILLVGLSGVLSLKPAWRKCCAPGEVFSSEKSEGCVPVSLRGEELADLAGVRDGFPDCDDPDDLETTLLDEFVATDLGMNFSACLEILRNEESRESELVLVHCTIGDATGEKVRVELPGIFGLRRCCPLGQIFSKESRTCKPANFPNDNEAFVSLLPKTDRDFVLINRGLPICRQHSIFDYVIHREDLTFENNALRAKLPGLSDELDKEEYIISEDNACLEMLTESEAETKLVIRTCGGPELCSKKACVRKCCPEDEAFMRNCQKFEAPTTALEFHQAVSDLWNYSESGFKDYGILVGSPCKYGMYPVLPEEKWNVTSNGHIYVPGYKVFEHHEYCMDIIYNRSHMEEALYPFVCFDSPTIDEYTETRFRVNAALELTSCTFLLLTLLVYACLPTLQNLHGKTLMCHVSSLLVAYTCLSIIIFATPEDSDKRHDYTSTPLCQFLGYTMLFSFLSTFSWLNVMCFDIWWTFGNLRGRNMRGRRERKKFFFYCLYSWGLAFFICIIGFVADFTEGLPFYLLPHIGEDRCWFATESAHKNAKTFFYGEVVFFIAPVTLQLISNIVFFVLTSIHCTKVKAEIRRVVDPSDPRSKRFHADRIKFIMNVKLFIVMGISWIMEVISFFLNKYAKDLEWRNEYFYVTDVMNCLQGLLIFILFVVKSRVYSSLRRRLGLSEKKRTVASNATATVQDPYKVKKSSSSSTLMSTFANSMVP